MQTMTLRDLLSLLAAAALPPPPAAAQPIIRTILRDVKPSAIDGPILIHEHLSLGGTDWGIERPASKWYDDVDLIANEVAACRASGVRCIVDMGTQRSRPPDWLAADDRDAVEHADRRKRRLAWEV